MPTDDELRKARTAAYFEAPYVPNPMVTGAEFRVANALEYAAYQLHDIRQSLRQLSGRQIPDVPEGE